MSSNEGTISAAQQSFLDIGARLLKKEFDIVLRCPGCGGRIDNFVCARCSAEPDRSAVKVSRSFMIVGTVLGWLVPFLCAGLGYAITRPGKAGLIVGFIIGLGLGGIFRRTERQGYNSAKASIAADLLLAQKYREDPATFDCAAFCYLHWLKTQDFPRPTDDLALFLWRYRKAAAVNTELRQALLDFFFYKMAYVIEAQGIVPDIQQANLMLAAANDSPEQLQVAQVVYKCCAWKSTLQILLSRNAPLVAAVLAGNPLPGETGKCGGEGGAVRYLCGPIWPEQMTELDIPPEEQARLVFVYSDGKRMVGMTDRQIWVGDIEPDVARTRIIFAEPLANIERVCEELSPDGKEHRGVWLFGRDHAYGFNGRAGLAATLQAVGAFPARIPVEHIRTPEEKFKLMLGLLGILVCGLATLVAIGMIIAGGGAINNKGGIAHRGMFILVLTVFPFFFFLIIGAAGGNGSRAGFLAACGVAKIKNLADPAIVIDKGK